MKLIVGLDFGTSTTVVRYKLEGENRVYELKEGTGITSVIPTAILKLKTGEMTYYGSDAVNNRASYPDDPWFSNFKMMLLSKDETVRIKGEELIIEFLSHINKLFKEQTENLSYDCLDVRVSYPAKWSDASIKFMKRAIEKAGFGTNITGVPEPIAASYNMLHNHNKVFEANGLLQTNKPVRVFMLDMGAGTTDIEIFKLTYSDSLGISITESLSYPTVDNKKLCGGHEIDEILSTYINKCAKDAGFNGNESIFTAHAAKQWKDANLSKGLKNNYIVPVPGDIGMILKYSGISDYKYVVESMSLTRDKFEELTAKHWRNLYQLIKESIIEYKKLYKVGEEDIDALFLTGGHSCWYVVPCLFKGESLSEKVGLSNKLTFTKLLAKPERMFLDSLPHECVANGLCLYNERVKLNNKLTIVSVESVVTNNVWISVSLNEKESAPIQIFRKGQPTRENGKHATYHFKKSLNIVKDFAFGNQKFNLSVTFFSGDSSADTAEKRVYHFAIEDKSKWKYFLRSILGLNSSWDFDFSIKFQVMDNGEICFSGICYMNHDKDKTVKFTEKDFNL